MSDVEITPDRAKGIRRLLYVILGFTVVLVILGLPLVFGDYVRYGLIVLGVALVLGIVGGLALQAVRSGTPRAKRLCIITGITTIVLSVPLIPIWIGLLTAVSGIGLLVVVVAPERETT
jgi:Na+/proline symporter